MSWQRITTAALGAGLVALGALALPAGGAGAGVIAVGLSMITLVVPAPFGKKPDPEAPAKKLAKPDPKKIPKQ